ncbi:MAG: hypothetical protein HY077_08495 [Elusimicrobia bacterium]|nr:hypothetical protein [Elusimicrobiota bacterium]
MKKGQRIAHAALRQSDIEVPLAALRRGSQGLQEIVQGFRQTSPVDPRQAALMAKPRVLGPAAGRRLQEIHVVRRRCRDHEGDESGLRAQGQHEHEGQGRQDPSQAGAVGRAALIAGRTAGADPGQHPSQQSQQRTQRLEIARQDGHETVDAQEIGRQCADGADLRAAAPCRGAEGGGGEQKGIPAERKKKAPGQPEGVAQRMPGDPAGGPDDDAARVSGHHGGADEVDQRRIGIGGIDLSQGRARDIGDGLALLEDDDLPIELPVHPNPRRQE